MDRLFLFQSTLPSQGATIRSGDRLQKIHDFNPRSPHRERLLALDDYRFALIFQSTLPSQGATATLTGGRGTTAFQSTLPSQGATIGAGVAACTVSHFNPRSPHRERLSETALATLTIYFNPRSPHRERPYPFKTVHDHFIFQSTLPSQGATANIHIKFLCDLLFSTLSSKNSFTLSRFPQTIT